MNGRPCTDDIVDKSRIIFRCDDFHCRMLVNQSIRCAIPYIAHQNGDNYPLRPRLQPQAKHDAGACNHEHLSMRQSAPIEPHHKCSSKTC
jgi:hypothetical protein